MTEPKRITVAPEGELASLLEEAKKTPLLLEKDGLVYRLAVDEEEKIWWGYYDPEEARRILTKMVGTLPREEADRMLADLDCRREAASKSPGKA